MDPRVPPRFEIAVSTHPGHVREGNEDACLDHPETGIWAVADGMGGHHAGAFASRTMIDALRRIEPQGSAAQLLARCEACVSDANSRILRIASEQELTIGTTLAVLLNYDVYYACVWSGDSRIYRVRDGTIAMLSRDHTEVQDLVDRGVLSAEEGRTSPRRNIVTRAIGVAPRAELELAQGVLADGDTFLLCTDGLTDRVSDGELCAGVSAKPSADACRDLLQLALDRGGADNITMIVVRYREDGMPYAKPAATGGTVVGDGAS